MRYKEIINVPVLRETDMSKIERMFIYDYLNDQVFKTRIGKEIADKLLQKAKSELAFDDVSLDEEAYDFNHKFIQPIQSYLWNLMLRARDRHEDLSDWYKLSGYTVDQILYKAKELRNSKLSNSDGEYFDDEDDDDEYDSGDHVGFAPYDPSMDYQHFIRFGPINKSGRSHFGLAGEDNEDGPDEWRVASGNRTHESGVSVFVATRSMDDPEGWDIQMPDFSLARYHVSNELGYLRSILPKTAIMKWLRNKNYPVAILIHGQIVTTKLHKRNAVEYAELGSDGEYLIDTTKPFKTFNIPFDKIYYEGKRLVDILEKIGYFRQ